MSEPENQEDSWKGMTLEQQQKTILELLKQMKFNALQQESLADQLNKQLSDETEAQKG